MGQLEGKVAIVTGASREIGAGAAFVLAKAGAAVMLVARDGKRALQLAEEIVANGGQAMAMSCDVSDYGSVRRVVEETERRLGRIDILVNNAGIIDPIGALAESDPAAWRRSIEVNLVGAYHSARATLPQMLEAGNGTVINVSSGAAHRPLEGWSAYCAGKAGLAMLTEAIALECTDAGIRVFGLAPGVVDTDMQATIRASGINRISQIRQIDLAPVGHPAAAIYYLCTAAADDLAGKELALDDPDFRRRVGLV
jgi:NAD(P)-dependent dehydrogenase (short-subunit alcohol dehydrogenase family)